jgi:hypothetical protein
MEVARGKTVASGRLATTGKHALYLTSMIFHHVTELDAPDVGNVRGNAGKGLALLKSGRDAGEASSRSAVNWAKGTRSG